MLKELIYTGIGATALLKEKVEEELKNLEEKGKIKTDDVKSFMESIEERGREEDEKFKAKLKDTLKDIIDELGIATKDDINSLREELK